MRIGIIGCGGIANVHGPIISNLPDTELVGVADKDINRAKSLAKELKLNISTCYQDAHSMIDEQKPDIVHVLVPPHQHSQVCIMAMNKGCHVLVEKPIAPAPNDVEKMIKAAEENNVHLCVDHNMVFKDVVQQAIELVSENTIGELVSVETYYSFDVRRYPAIVEDGAEYCHWTYSLNGGPLEDLMPHTASLVCEFISEINDVQYIGQNRGVLPEGWQDEIRVLIKSNTVIGYISISLNEKPDIILLTLKGKKGIVQADLFNNILTIRKRSGLPRAISRGLSGFQLSQQTFKGSLRNIYKFATGKVDKSDGVAGVISRFYDFIKNGGDPPVSSDKGLRVTDLMHRIWPTPVKNVCKNNLPPHRTTIRNNAPTALVTGASGFIGIHLVKKLLSENIGIRALVRPNSIHAGRLKTVDVDVIEGDLSNPEILSEATKGIQTVYHAGAAMSNSWEEHEAVTIKGTEHLINAALANKVKRFVHLSTLAVYELFSINHDMQIKEDSPYQNRPKQMGPYAYAKIEAEKLLLDAYRNHGLGITIVRPGMVIGPMGRVFFPHLGYRYQDNVFFLIGKGGNLLPLTFVENTVDGIYKASIHENAIGQIYNLVDDGEITSKIFVETFLRITGISGRVVTLPYILPYSATTAYEFAALCGILKKGVTSRAQLKWKQSKVKYDSSKAKNDLGWEPKIPIEDALNKTFTWYAERYGNL